MILILNILAASIDIGHCLYLLVICTSYIANVRARDVPSVRVLLKFKVKLTCLHFGGAGDFVVRVCFGFNDS
jgi:hypothetical protein